jgi:ribosome biogenesis GTPase
MSGDADSPHMNHAAGDALFGTVLAVQANFYFVKLDSASLLPRPTLLCTRRSRLKKLGQRVMVGDRVQIEEPDWQGDRGAIAAVLPRQSELNRPPIANADQILLVFAMAEPTLDLYQLSRFLVKAESTDLSVCLCLSKSDLVSEAEQLHWQHRLQQWNYESIFISVYESYGLEELFQQLRDRVTVVSGPSGVGKSSLINALIPQANLRVGDVSGKLARGRHTTRHVELFELPTGGLLADTPGFNQPELDCPPEALADYFPEIRHRLMAASCQFSDCLHRDEPGCVVSGDWARYEIYLLLLEEAIARQESLDRTRDQETTLKLKSSRDGRASYEPKLELKKYRRQSRRSQQQELLVLQREEGIGVEEAGEKERGHG